MSGRRQPPRLDDLPDVVEFANWSKYQRNPNASHYALLAPSFLYDARLQGGGDASRGRFAAGLVLALGGHGAVSVRAWSRYSDDTRGLRRDLKRWLDNGLLIGAPPTRKEERKEERKDMSVAVAPAAELVLDVKPAAPRRSWQESYCAAWEAVCGAGSWRAVAGEAAKYMRPLHEAHGPDLVAATLARYLAASSPEFRSLHRFAAGFAQWSAPDASRATELAIVEHIRKKLGKYGGPKYLPTQFFDEELDEPERVVWRKRGGAGPIWAEVS